MRRTRRFILLLIAVIVAGIAVTYITQRALQERTAPAKPAKLPESVSARADKWVWEETRQGRPSVRVEARAFRQNAEGSNIELDDVELQLFHDDKKTFDRVKSAKADFNLAEETLFSEGEVEITTGVPSDSSRKTAARLVTIKTSGVRFESKTGKASTDRPASFQFDRGQGQSTGAVYDPATRELQMHKDVKLLWRGSGKGPPMEVEAGSLIYKESESRILLLPWAKFKRETLSMEGGGSVISLNNDGIEWVESQSAKGVDQRPDRRLDYAAEYMKIDFDEAGVLKTILGDRNAKLVSTAKTGVTTVDAGRLDLTFEAKGSDALLRKALATHGSVVESKPVAQPKAPPPDTRILRADATAVYMRDNGEEIERAETESPGTIEFIPNRPGQKRRIVHGERMWMDYGANNQLRQFRAVAVTTRTTGPKNEPPALTSSKTMIAEFDDKTGALARIEQVDDFTYEEADRRARANKAELFNATEEIHLTGAARAWDATGSTSADAITLYQKTGAVEANGNVSSTRVPDKKKKSQPGMLNNNDPLQAKAQRMVSAEKNNVIIYTGKALLWQGPNRLEASEIRINRNTGQLAARENVISQSMERADEKKKKPSLYTIVRAPQLDYDDKQRLAHYKGGATLVRGGMTVTSRELRAFLDEESNLDHALADGTVKVNQAAPDRIKTGTAEHAEYYTKDSKVVLTGGQPRLVDSVSGTTTGQKITYYSDKDELIVEGESSKPAESQLRRRTD